MNCIPKALAHLLDTEPVRIEQIFKVFYPQNKDGWTDTQLVYVAAMHGVFLTPFVQAEDPRNFVMFYYTLDGILVGNTEFGKPHAAAKRNGKWDARTYPPCSDLIYYGVGRTGREAICQVMEKAS